MRDPFLPDIQSRIRQSFLLGLARAPLVTPEVLRPFVPAGSEPALALLALAGQRQRFVSPLPLPIDDVPDAARQMHQDPRPVLPEPARRPLLRLRASVEKAHASLILAVAVERIMAAGFRLHPFDLPELARHVRGSPEKLGVAERAYLALTAAESDEDAGKGLFFDRISHDNWTTFSKSQRRAFVIELRRADPAAGRTLVEDVWKSEPAPVRLALLEGLAVGLSADDKPFLDKLVTDRADTVKQLAALLAGRLDVSAGSVTDRASAAAEAFQKPKGGGLAGMMSAIGIGGKLRFTPPGDPNDRQAGQTLRDKLFAGLALDDLARAAGVTPDEIIDVLPADENHIVHLLLETALTTQDLTTVRRIVARRLLSGAVTMPLALPLVAKARVALTRTDAEALVASPAWQRTVSEFAAATTPGGMKDDGSIVAMATLMPPQVVHAFLTSIAALTPGLARGARDFAELTTALSKTGSTS